MKPSNHRKCAKLILVSILITSIIGNLTLVIGDIGYSQANDTYSYRFLVDNDGSALVVITFTSNKKFGSSWVTVPRFLRFNNRTLHGRILNFSLESSRDKVDIDYYFYNVLEFFFESNGYFEMVIEYNFTSAAIVIEPKGIFFSPLIGFQPDGIAKAEIILPLKFRVQRAIAGSGHLPSSKGSNYVRFDELHENLLRIEIEFAVEDDMPDFLKIERGIFTFNTVRRYEKSAESILNLFNETYYYFASLFNTTIERVNIEFFVPEFEYLFSVGGYVPFSGSRVGDIHINIFYTRYVEGYIEVTALHELVHHFLWKAGISPKDFLWFHEGMAQYVSTEVSLNRGYEGASMIKKELEDAASQLDKWNDLSYLSKWTLSVQPADWGTLYASAYYVVTRLAEPYGGLNYYARFFKLLHGEEIKDYDELAYYLSLAANETVVPRLRSWGFEVADLFTYSNLIMEVKRSVQEINPLFQPYKFLAERLYEWALMNAKQGRMDTANRFLLITMIITKLSPLLTLVTVSAILFGAILFALKRKGLFSD